VVAEVVGGGCKQAQKNGRPGVAALQYIPPLSLWRNGDSRDGFPRIAGRRSREAREYTMMTRSFLIGALLLTLGLAACSGPEVASSADDVVCDDDNGGLNLPDGFCAVTVADSVGRARHIAVRDNGDVYVALRQMKEGGGIVALRDTSGDGRADVMERFGTHPGTGMAIADGYLYFAPDTAVFRYPLRDDELLPGSDYELIASGFPVQGLHAPKTISLDGNGGLYVNVGAPSNNCQDETQAIAPQGTDPCPQLARHAGIWRFDAARTAQTQERDATHFAVGVRNSVAMAWNASAGALYVVEHARDVLRQAFPDLYTDEQGAELPAEQFIRIEEGATYSWPYCYFDHLQGRHVLSPEYGGDGTVAGRCEAYPLPLMGFPGHYSPNGLVFYEASHFPQRYRAGAFVAFHGSWNRSPFEQKGFNVVFVPFRGGVPSGDWEVFADGFAGVERVESVGQARYRPMSVAIGPDGSLYVGDSVRGRIWRIVYRGQDV
jgi:glucose/arabinose dehydrogenase